MAKEKVSVESLVKDALVKLATSDGPMRLSGKGDHPPLFAKTNKEVLAQLQAADNPLVRTEGSTKKLVVKLTAAGFALALPGLPEDKVGPLAKGFAADIPDAADRIAFLQDIVGRTPLATAELLPVLEETRVAERAETEARLAAAARRRAAEEASRAAVERWLALLDGRQAERVAALRRELEIEGAKAEAPVSPKPAPIGKVGEPQTADDHSFRRDTADQLTAAWRAAWDDKKADAREYLESAIWNISGLRAIGEAGQRVTFDGRVHECGSGVSTGETVRVVRPGWLLEDENDREYVALKALVEK